MAEVSLESFVALLEHATRGLAWIALRPLGLNSAYFVKRKNVHVSA